MQFENCKVEIMALGRKTVKIEGLKRQLTEDALDNNRDMRRITQ